MKCNVTAQDRIIELLRNTKRDGIEKIIAYLTESDFFSAPASTRFHGCYEGGLADHSLGVYYLLSTYNVELKLEVNADEIIIATLLHDVCKIGAYIPKVAGGYKWNRNQPKGHALLSLLRIAACDFVLTDLEEMMIKYHMGVYGLTEFEPGKGEYPLRGGAMANAWYHHPIVKMMYFCDEITMLREIAKERR